jgi:hypothetical protein
MELYPLYADCSETPKEHFCGKVIYSSKFFLGKLSSNKVVFLKNAKVNVSFQQRYYYNYKCAKPGGEGGGVLKPTPPLFSKIQIIIGVEWSKKQ